MSLPITCTPEALQAFCDLTPAERGEVVEQWYARQQPRPSTRYKRARYSLQLLQDLLDTSEQHIQQHGFYGRASDTDYTGSALMSRLNTIESYLTDLQVTNPTYRPLKIRLEELRRQYQLELELLKSRRIKR